MFANDEKKSGGDLRQPHASLSSLDLIDDDTFFELHVRAFAILRIKHILLKEDRCPETESRTDRGAQLAQDAGPRRQRRPA